jgi:plastocyanin
MKHRTLAVGVAAATLALGAGSVAVAASTAAPSRTTIKEKQSFVFKPNRYVQDGLRWNKDVYHVRRGGTLHVVNNKASEGPHTFSVVRKKDLPESFAAANTCKACAKIIAAHGADPNTEAPPKFQFVENGKGQSTAPNIDRPGDSAVTGPGKKGESVNLKVTAKKGTTLYFMCLIHPWMQGKVVVG